MNLDKRECLLWVITTIKNLTILIKITNSTYVFSRCWTRIEGTWVSHFCLPRNTIWSWSSDRVRPLVHDCAMSKELNTDGCSNMRLRPTFPAVVISQEIFLYTFRLLAPHFRMVGLYHTCALGNRRCLVRHDQYIDFCPLADLLGLTTSIIFDFQLWIIRCVLTCAKYNETIC